VAEDGTTYQVHAGSVVLATGGYGNSTRWLTEELLEDSLYYGLTTSTGDGLSVAVDDVDAATRMIEYAKLYPNGVEVSEHRAKSTIDGNLVVWPMSTILVSPEGERVVNEKASNHDILEVELQQTGSMLFLLMDAANYEAWSAKLPGTGFNMDLVAQWLEENGESTPIFAHGETLEDLAGRVGIDPEVLVTTVEDYNAGVRAGADEFGRSGDYLQMEIGDGPYYMVEQKPRYATTMGGLVINDALEVQSADGASIAGLYAAGEVVGGVMGSNSPSGANNAWAITSGKLAAESACA
jgi:fumarate reductase flavoprotein subunit